MLRHFPRKTAAVGSTVSLKLLPECKVVDSAVEAQFFI